MTPYGVVALQDGLGTAGCITYWHLSGDVQPGALAAAWEKAGLDLDQLPRLPTARIAHGARDDQEDR
jgi:hypothetical protein